MIRRSIAPATIIGVLLSLVGAYRSDAVPLVPRTLLMVAIALVATLMGTIIFRLLGRSAAVAARWPLHGGLAALAMAAPMGVVAWTADQLVFHPGPPLRALPGFIPLSLATSLFFCLLAARWRRAQPATEAAPAESPAKFLERLPPKLRGAELFAVEAEDHYLRLHTSRGEDLVLMRLSDALDELQGLEGAQTHRSWWVARDAIADIRRGDGRAILTLKNGAQAPVSRTHARALRARGWL